MHGFVSIQNNLRICIVAYVQVGPEAHQTAAEARNAAQADREAAPSSLAPQLQALTRSEIRALGATVREFSFPPARLRSSSTTVTNNNQNSSISQTRVNEICHLSGLGIPSRYSGGFSGGTSAPEMLRYSEAHAATPQTAGNQQAQGQSRRTTVPIAAQPSFRTVRSPAPAGGAAQMPQQPASITDAIATGRTSLSSEAPIATRLLGRALGHSTDTDSPQASAPANDQSALLDSSEIGSYQPSASYLDQLRHPSSPGEGSGQMLVRQQARAHSEHFNTPVWQSLYQAPPRGAALPPAAVQEAPPPTTVLLLRLGMYRFKGAPEPVEMVHMVQEQLAGRRCGRVCVFPVHVTEDPTAAGYTMIAAALSLVMQSRMLTRLA